MTPTLLAAGIVACCLLAVPAQADENQDIDLIPPDIQAPTVASETPSATGPGKLFLENAVTFYDYRNNLLVKLPQTAPPPNVLERLFFDARRSWTLGEAVGFTYSGRLNVLAQDRADFPTHDSIRNDLREAFLSWSPLPQSYLDLGRVNLRSGVATGFNPTDFFKTRAVVDRLSNDPAVLRENRLGTFMVLGQGIGEKGAVSVAYAPALYRPSALYLGSLPSFDPMLDRTNAHDRFLVKGNYDLIPGLSSEALLYHEGSTTRIGANLTQPIGDAVVAYAEWSGGRRYSLAEEAYRYGQATGTLPSSAPRVLPGDRGKHFYNDLATGASLTTANKITINVEYHLHEAGFTRQDWKNWFAAGQSRFAPASAAASLWYIRSYALDQNEPMTRDTAFIRIDRADAFIRDLELAAFADISLYDGSALVQVTADYYWSPRWTIGAILAGNLGSRRSEHGSMPQAGSALLKATRYF
ncbi:MAG: hypothetical protein JWL84_4833 [Rhodospirillales bacterium]|nr:hypothetical protein [Rhodospirillales bacterium]